MLKERHESTVYELADHGEFYEKYSGIFHPDESDEEETEGDRLHGARVQARNLRTRFFYNDYISDGEVSPVSG